MLSLVLVLATAVVAVPSAAALPPDACQTEFPVCPTVEVLERYVDQAGNQTTRIIELLETIGEDQPGAAAVDETRKALCGAPGSPQDQGFLCQQIAGNPGTGQLTPCGPRPANNFVGLTLWTLVQTADPVVANTTSEGFAGTALEGESVCHDHWTTLRALATLP